MYERHKQEAYNHLICGLMISCPEVELKAFFILQLISLYYNNKWSD